jgi:hypothetical protein
MILGSESGHCIYSPVLNPKVNHKILLRKFSCNSIVSSSSTPGSSSSFSSSSATPSRSFPSLVQALHQGAHPHHQPPTLEIVAISKARDMPCAYECQTVGAGEINVVVSLALQRATCALRRCKLIAERGLSSPNVDISSPTLGRDDYLNFCTIIRYHLYVQSQREPVYSSYSKAPDNPKLDGAQINLCLSSNL